MYTVKPSNVSPKFAEAIGIMVAERVSNNWYPSGSSHGGQGGANVLTGYISKDPTPVTAIRMYPCHKPINSFMNAEILWSGFGWRTKKAAAIYYHNWLLTKSPWSKTGIVPTKLSKEFMFNEGFVFDNLEKTPANLLHNFLIATRMAAEWPAYIDDWYMLVTKHGIEPAFAFAFLTSFMPIGSDYFSTAVTPFQPKIESVLATLDKYDWPLDMARATEDYVRNFISGQAVGKSDYGFSPAAKTAPVNTLWGALIDHRDKTSYKSILSGLYYEKFSKKRSTPVSRNIFHTSVITDTENIFTADVIIEIAKLEQERLSGTTNA